MASVAEDWALRQEDTDRRGVWNNRGDRKRKLHYNEMFKKYRAHTAVAIGHECSTSTNGRDPVDDTNSLGACLHAMPFAQCPFAQAT